MNDLPNYIIGFKLMAPATCLVLAILVACLWNLFFPKNKEWTPFWSLLGLGSAMYFLVQQFYVGPLPLFDGIYTIDKLTVAFGLLSCLVGAVVVLMTVGYEHHLGRNRGEFYAILLTAVLATILLAGSTDLIMLFVSLETLSICCVLLAGFEKRSVKSSEASLKYLLSTAAVTATFLYGLSFVYGLTGSTTYSAIHDKLQLSVQSPASLITMFMLILIISAVGFKLSIVPFHMWTPDVYEGAPTPVTAFLSIGSKAGGFAMALRLLMLIFDKAAPDWIMILSCLAILSMVVGNLIALAQKSFKRMLAYSSIAHVGYILIGLVAGTAESLTAMMFYIIVYGFMNLGAFAGAIMVENETGSDNIDDYAGLIKKRPILAIAISICLLNLAGLPLPPAGFFAKVFVFWAGLANPLSAGGVPMGAILVGVALVTSIPAIYYYTRVVIKMVVREPSDRVLALGREKEYIDSPQEGPLLAMVICLAVIVATGTTFVDPVMKFSREAVNPIITRQDRSSPLGNLPAFPSKGVLVTESSAGSH